MAEVLPQIKVTDPQDGPSLDDSPTSSSVTDNLDVTKDARFASGGSIEVRPITNNKSFPNKLIRNLSNSHVGQIAASEGRRESQTIDPLSAHILKRTQPEHMTPQRFRTGASSEGEFEYDKNGDLSAPARVSAEPIITRADSHNSTNKEKNRKGVSFLSRFIGSKRKDVADFDENASDQGDRRTEGMDADVFSQPIGFIPRFPAPPKYIKVRSHGKKEKEFNRVFLAQELRGRTSVEIAQAGGRVVRGGAFNDSNTKKDGNAVWAMEFSKDGEYLAAGGRDYSVRVWAVIATPEDRRAHEKEEDAVAKNGESVRLNAPVFKTKTVQEYGGHTASVLDLSWSKNNFLLSSSMDKTVKLWHLSRTECLCTFTHSDFVTSIQFHPRDDRFFLAGSLDSKLRFWSIPDKNVAFSSQLPDLITAVAFSPDGKTAIAGCLNGLCLFYDTEGLKLQSQIHVRSAHGKNAKGSKVTGIQAINYPPDDANGEIKVLITSNDSRVRVYNLRDKGLEIKVKGNENSCSQIHASFNDDMRYIICGSEDRKAYIWSTGPPEKDKDKRPVEMFEAHSAIVTIAIMAPVKTRQLLGVSGDPLYDLCNPPPVTLVSRSESHSSSKPPTENDQYADGSVPPTPTVTDHSKPQKSEESPAYIARSAHPDGNIIVTADYMGHIKVFRQDCAYQNRLRNETWDAKKMLGRNSSVATRNSRSSGRESLPSPHPSSDRILSWRQTIVSNSSLDNLRNGHHRSVSPRKSIGQASLQSTNTTPRNNNHTLTTTDTPSISTTSPPASTHKTSQDSTTALHDPATPDLFQKPHPAFPVPDHDPLVLQGDQSYMFWNKQVYRDQAAGASRHDRDKSGSNGGSSNGSYDPTHLGLPIGRRESAVSALSSEESSVEDGERGAEARCRRCGGRSFRASFRGKGEKMVECAECGMLA